MSELRIKKTKKKKKRKEVWALVKVGPKSQAMLIWTGPNMIIPAVNRHKSIHPFHHPKKLMLVLLINSNVHFLI